MGIGRIGSSNKNSRVGSPQKSKELDDKVPKRKVNTRANLSKSEVPPEFQEKVRRNAEEYLGKEGILGRELMLLNRKFES